VGDSGVAVASGRYSVVKGLGQQTRVLMVASPIWDHDLAADRRRPVPQAEPISTTSPSGVP
jgi:hypothetical protein